MSSGLSAYISCPVSVPQKELDKVAEALKGTISGGVCYWLRGSHYTDKYIQGTDVFVLMLPRNRFAMDIKHLPAGCRTELRKAKNLNKRIYLAYTKSSSNTPSFYETNVDIVKDISSVSEITGLPGTTSNLYLLDDETVNPEFSCKGEEIKDYNPKILLLKLKYGKS